MTTAVLFDLFETLITESGAKPPRASSIGPRLGLDADAFRAEWGLRRQSVVLGQRSFREALAEIAHAFGQQVSASELDRIVDDRIRAKAAIIHRCHSEVVTMVRLLRQSGLRLAVISNCFREDVAEWKDCTLAPHFKAITFSFEIGLAKPNPVIYVKTCLRLGVTPGEAVFIGDGAQNELEGAETAGIRAYQALWFRQIRPHEHPWQRALANVNDVVGIV